MDTEFKCRICLCECGVNSPYIDSVVISGISLSNLMKKHLNSVDWSKIEAKEGNHVKVCSNCLSTISVIHYLNESSYENHLRFDRKENDIEPLSQENILYDRIFFESDQHQSCEQPYFVENPDDPEEEDDDELNWKYDAM